MADQRRPVRPRRSYVNPRSAHNPIDEFWMVPTDPRYLTRQGYTGNHGLPGLIVDGRRSRGSYDTPGYTGDLSQPVHTTDGVP